MNNETCNCHACTQVRWRATLQGQIEPMILLPARTPIFTDYEIRALKELVKRSDMHFLPEASLPESETITHPEGYKAVEP